MIAIKSKRDKKVISSRESKATKRHDKKKE